MVSPSSRATYAGNCVTRRFLYFCISICKLRRSAPYHSGSSKLVFTTLMCRNHTKAPGPIYAQGGQGRRREAKQNARATNGKYGTPVDWGWEQPRHNGHGMLVSEAAQAWHSPLDPKSHPKAIKLERRTVQRGGR